jgi:hypothetical protein
MMYLSLNVPVNSLTQAHHQNMIDLTFLFLYVQKNKKGEKGVSRSNILRKKPLSNSSITAGMTQEDKRENEAKTNGYFTTACVAMSYIRCIIHG